MAIFTNKCWVARRCQNRTWHLRGQVLRIIWKCLWTFMLIRKPGYLYYCKLHWETLVKPGDIRPTFVYGASHTFTKHLVTFLPARSQNAESALCQSFCPCMYVSLCVAWRFHVPNWPVTIKTILQRLVICVMRPLFLIILLLRKLCKN